MLSVCVVTQQYGQVLSGTGLYAQNLIKSLVDEGHRLTVVAPRDQRPSGDLPFRFVEVSPPMFSHTQARWLSLAWGFARKLGHLKRQETFDLIHFTDARESLFFDRSTMTTVGNVHDTYAAGVRSLDYYRDHYVDWLARWTYYRFVRLCEKLAVPRLEGIIANSEHTAKKLIEEYRISPERIHVCYVCIESKDYVVTSGIHNLGGSDSPRVLFVGGNMQRKGLPTLIRAAPDIVNAVPNIEFWVVGRDRIEPHMRQLCRDRDVSRYFRFLGWKPHGELIQMYAEADIFVMPSLEEALGVTFLEAMASRVPSIGTRVGGIPELIDHGYNGLLIDPEDVSALAQAVVELINSTRLHRRLVDGGLTTVNRFTVEKMMQCTHRTYQALLCK